MVFPAFFNSNLNFTIKSQGLSHSQSQCCFSWLHRASPSLTAKNIINLISVLAISWCPCVVFSCVAGRRCLLWPVHSPGKTLYLPVTPGVSWLATFAFQSPIMKRTSLGVLVLKGLVGLHRTVQLQLLQHYWLGHRLGLPRYWMVCLGNEQRSFCHFWDWIQVRHFRFFYWLWTTPFLLRDSFSQ